MGDSYLEILEVIDYYCDRCNFNLPDLQVVDILKPVWFLAFQKTKSWLQLSPDWKTPRTLLGQNCFWIFPKTILR
jgi:hypothetical protein